MLGHLKRKLCKIYIFTFLLDPGPGIPGVRPMSLGPDVTHSPTHSGKGELVPHLNTSFFCWVKQGNSNMIVFKPFRCSCITAVSGLDHCPCGNSDTTDWQVSPNVPSFYFTLFYQLSQNVSSLYLFHSLNQLFSAWQIYRWLVFIEWVIPECEMISQSREDISERKKPQ